MFNHKNFFFFMLVASLLTIVGNAEIRYSIVGGNWSAGSTWTEGIIPTLQDTVKISNGATVTIDVFGASCSVLEVDHGGRVEITSSVGFLTVTNRIDLGSINGNTTGTIYMTDGNLSIGGLVDDMNMRGSIDAQGGTIKYGLLTASNQTILPATYHNLILGPGTKTAGGNLIVNGYLRIQSSSTFNAGSYTHHVYGDWNNEGTFSAGTSTIGLRGIFPQTIIGDNTFNSLFFDAGVKTATSDITVNGDFRNFVDGTFEAGSYTHNFKGHFTNDGTFVPGTSTVRFSGASAQTITGATTFNNLTIGTGGTKTTASPLTVNGEFLVLSSGSFDAGSQTHTLKGDWTNNGSFAAGTSTIILNGSAQQTISGTVRFNNLTVDNPSGVRLTNASTDTLAGTLAFNAGRLQLGPSNLRLGNNAVVTGAAAGQCIVTNGSGKVSHRIVGGASAESFQFPVGPNSTTYNPLTITLRPNANEPTEVFEVGVSEFDNSSPGFGTIDTSQCVLRVWDVSESTPGGNRANLTFQWNTTEDGANIGVTLGNPVQLAAYHYASGTYSFVEDAVGPAPINNPISASTLGYLAADFGSFVLGRPGLVTSVAGEESVPIMYYLGQNYPNPFNPSTTIQFEMPDADFVTLKVYTLLGQEVATIVNESRQAGRYSERFDASHLATGVYMYRLATGSRTATKKLVLMK